MCFSEELNDFFCARFFGGLRTDTSTSLAESVADIMRTALILGLALPANVQGQDYTVGATMKIDYDLPSNATQLFGQAAERALGRLTRWQLYATAEAALSSMGVDGRACVLRAICEAAETPLRQDSLLAELSHLLLTPSTTDSGSSEGRRYLAAEHAGVAAGGGGGGGEGCAALYRECAASPLHYLTVLTSS
ncbi:uncharacterized protein LOC126095414 [Schistocerca cancellata]|uniref:uncharacterized protein LOC126095414 n=1 Tax=Schistocerca cancellata TaxID=274614 RepID=UPI00211890F4|nr:uncharacterized protein LOC126095414 [Schistocerca cancellata]